MTSRQTNDKYEFDVDFPIHVLEETLRRAKEAQSAGALKRNRKGEEVYTVLTLSSPRAYGRDCPGSKGVHRCEGGFTHIEDIGWRTVVETRDVHTLNGVEKQLIRVMVRDQPCCKKCRP